MKSMLIFATVLLVCQAANVPTEVIHKVTVPVPSNVLSPPPLPSSVKPQDIEIPAIVQEVTKNHKPVTDKTEEEVLTTVQPETKTIMPLMDIEITTLSDPLMADETQRKTRAMPFSDNEKQHQQPQLSTDINVIKELLDQRKKMPASNRAMRSVVMTENSMAATTKEMSTQNPVIKSIESDMAATIDPCDLLCTKFEFEPICATNGLCLHEFPNQCILETFNCKHKSGKFTATKDDRCQMHWLTKCEESELI
ncbi:uncharacterized protein LOC135954475 [Calliphora vicina]|uniref:uncharacterized protein LOC135954475 n=1 Tax=Calliphora vicina TaxID=7373 RepID=UPI00325A71F5